METVNIRYNSVHHKMYICLGVIYTNCIEYTKPVQLVESMLLSQNHHC